MRPTKTIIDDLPGIVTKTAPGAAVHIARVLALRPDGSPEVLLNGGGVAVAARLALRTTRDRIQAAIASRQGVVVVFENGDCSKPIIIGFIEPLDTEEDESPSRLPFIDADVDGRRVRVTAHDEIVLECGSASITLRRNGRVVVRGTYVETHSDGTNRIKGGQVQIN